MDGRWTSGFSETFSHVFDRPQRFAARHSRLRRHFHQAPEFRARAYRAERGTARVREREELKGEET